MKTTMKAAAIDRLGGPEVLTIHVLPVPKISSQGSVDCDRRSRSRNVGRIDAPRGRLEEALSSDSGDRRCGHRGGKGIARATLRGRRFRLLLQVARRFAADGIDAVLAFAGGKELTACIQTLRKGGRVAYPNGVEPTPKKRKGITITMYDAIPGVRELERLSRAIERYGLIVPIAKIYKLKAAAKAHERLERGHVLGKIVLRVP